METKCIANCNRGGSEHKCNGHSIEDIIQSIEKQVLSLSQLSHKNLISYECVLCMKKKEGLVLYLVQDFVLGTSVNSITGFLGWCIEGASIVARGVLDALIYLHNRGVSHNNLYDSTVFMDNSGSIRITDFALVPYLLDLNGAQKTYSNDLPALGMLIESLSPIPHADMRDFIERCKSSRTLSASDLLEHPFLRPTNPGTVQVRNLPITTLAQATTEAVKERRPTTVTPPSINSGRSRLSTEFEELNWLGEGAYGDVLKVRNILDNREYAIKRIPLLANGRRQLQKKMIREVELLSRLNHENVVRYFNSWIENSSVAEQGSMHRIRLAGGDWSEQSSQKSVKKMPLANQIDEASTLSDDWLRLVVNN